MTDVQVVDGGALDNAPIDQVAVAKRYPRDEVRAMEKAERWATRDVATAEECHFALPRGDGVEGPSIRLAEILATSWGNLRCASRVVRVEDEVVVAEGAAHDLETNLLILREVRRPIVTRDGKRYGADMIAMTGNAAGAVALRNAILQVVPRGQWYPIYEKALETAGGVPLKEQQRRCLTAFAEQGIDQRALLEFSRVQKADALDARKLQRLRGVLVGIKEGRVDVAEMFGVATGTKRGGSKRTPPKRVSPEETDESHRDALWDEFVRLAPDCPSENLTEIEANVAETIHREMSIKGMREAVKQVKDATGR